MRKQENRRLKIMGGRGRRLPVAIVLRFDRVGRREPSPTKANSEISKFISTFKRFCNKEYGENIWQRSYYDHIIRNEEDFLNIWKYIDGNPIKSETEKEM